MEQIITNMMDAIDQEMRDQGCYLGVDELYELALAELRKRDEG